MRDTFAQITNTMEANDLILRAVEAQALRAMDRDAFYQSWRDRPGPDGQPRNTVAGAAQAWQEYIRQTPLVARSGRNVLFLNEYLQRALPRLNGDLDAAMREWRPSSTAGAAAAGEAARDKRVSLVEEIMREVNRPRAPQPQQPAQPVRGRIEAVLDYATVHGWREGANAARWRGHLDKVFPRRGKVRPMEHHVALPWQDLPAFMAKLRRRDAVAARALEFAILTAARSGEVLGARWSEIDLDAAVWTVPKERMKAGKEHRVPLAPAAVALLRGLLPQRRADDPDPLVFPGQRKGRPLSVMAMAMALRRMDHGDLTVHGFRSTFRDWAGETTAHPREVVEAALAHRLGDKVEQAYARGDLFAKRRRLMEDWADFCAEVPAEVVQLGERRAAEAAGG